MTGYKLKVYSKLTGIILVLVIVLLFIASNREQVTVKFLAWDIWTAPLFAFIIAVASMGTVVFLITRKVRKVLGEFKEIRREDKTRKQLVSQVKKEVEHEAELK